MRRCLSYSAIISHSLHFRLWNKLCVKHVYWAVNLLKCRLWIWQMSSQVQLLFYSPLVIVGLAVASDHGLAAAVEQTCFDWRAGWMYYRFGCDIEWPERWISVWVCGFHTWFDSLWISCMTVASMISRRTRDSNSSLIFALEWAVQVQPSVWTTGTQHITWVVYSPCLSGYRSLLVSSNILAPWPW